MKRLRLAGQKASGPKKKTRLAQMLVHQQNKTAMTEAELGAEYGWSQQSFWTWKNGSIPRNKMFPAIARFLQISIADLEELVDEAKISTGTTKLPNMGPPVMGRGTFADITMERFPSGYARPSVDGTYVVRVDGRNMWVSSTSKPTDGNTMLVRRDDAARLETWPVGLADGEEAHVVVLAEMV